MLLNCGSRMRSVHYGIDLTEARRSPADSLCNRPGHIAPFVATVPCGWSIRLLPRLVNAGWYDLLALATAAQVERSWAGRASHQDDLPRVIVIAQGSEGLLTSLCLPSRACPATCIILRVPVQICAGGWAEVRVSGLRALPGHSSHLGRLTVDFGPMEVL